MSTDLEQELRELFRDKAGDAPVTTQDVGGVAPLPVLRRARRRQVGTVVGSAAIAFAIAIGSVAGLNAVLRGAEDRDIGGARDVFERTATIEAFTITSPSNWYLVNRWPASMQIAVGPVLEDDPDSTACLLEPSTGDVLVECPAHGLPMLQLSNVDLGLNANACLDLPANGAALYVASYWDMPRTADLEPFPPDLRGPSNGPCGPGLYSHFTVNRYPMFAWAGVGPDASPEDREIVETAYESMSAADAWEPSHPSVSSPAYVIAGGEYGPGDPWRLDLRQSGDALELTLEGRGGDVLTADDSAAPLASAGTDPIFGVVEEGAPGVEFRPGTENEDFDLGQSPVAGTIVDVPPTIDAFDLDLFFIDPPAEYGDLGGRVVITGSAPLPSASASPEPESRADVVSLSGGDATDTWIVRFTGAFEDGSACIAVRVVGGSPDRLCPTRDGSETSLAGANPSLHLWVLPSVTILAGSVPPEVRDVRFVPDGGDARIVELQCTTGPIGWSDKDVCAIRLSREGSGTLEYLDADGAVVFEDGIGWGAADPQPTPVQPVHGGTYWAVYAWLGAPGDPVAADVSARLRRDFDIEAFPGDLACDEGAAEALGTNAEQGIAVYFETEEEAQAFAVQAGLLDHERRVIAHVTTYCLD